jgi:hypothetical protein
MQVKSSTFTVAGGLGGSSAAAGGAYGDGSVRPPIQPGAQLQAAAETTTTTTTTSTSAESQVMNNPLYQPSGQSGTNPLHRSDFTAPAKPLVNLSGK